MWVILSFVVLNYQFMTLSRQITVEVDCAFRMLSKLLDKRLLSYKVKLVKLYARFKGCKPLTKMKNKKVRFRVRGTAYRDDKNSHMFSSSSLELKCVGLRLMFVSRNNNTHCASSIDI